jgi:uncharacterized membrane protein YhaH (DUF805 family)
MADVFISYAREDYARAEQVARGLQAMGLDPFWDTEIPPGQTWADYIEGKLTACKAVVVLWSEHSTKSQWVREEARMGRDKSKLIPALLDGSPAPFGFGEVQAANLSTWRGEPDHPDWRRFSHAIFAAARDGAQAPASPAPSSPYRPPPPPAAPSYAAASTPTGAAENLSAFGYVQKCLRLFVDGKGRARRAEYWWWVLFTFVIYIIAYALDIAAFGFNTYTSLPNQQTFYIIAALALLAPSVSVLSRRFHDVGLNGWLVALAFGLYIAGSSMIAAAMPAGSILVGVVALVVLVIAIIPSRAGANQYGPNPKGQ